MALVDAKFYTLSAVDGRQVVWESSTLELVWYVIALESCACQVPFAGHATVIEFLDRKLCSVRNFWGGIFLSKHTGVASSHKSSLLREPRTGSQTSATICTEIAWVSWLGKYDRKLKPLSSASCTTRVPLHCRSHFSSPTGVKSHKLWKPGLSVGHEHQIAKAAVALSVVARWKTQCTRGPWLAPGMQYFVLQTRLRNVCKPLCIRQGGTIGAIQIGMWPALIERELVQLRFHSQTLCFCAAVVFPKRWKWERSRQHETEFSLESLALQAVRGRRPTVSKTQNPSSDCRSNMGLQGSKGCRAMCELVFLGGIRKEYTPVLLFGKSRGSNCRIALCCREKN